MSAESAAARAVLVTVSVTVWAAVVAVAELGFAVSVPLVGLPSAIADGLSGGTELSSIVVAEVNLPRVVLALLGGAAFAVAGLMMQEALANPLATPELLGVAPCAAVALAGAQTFQLPLPQWLNPLLGTFGGLLGGLLVALVAAAMPTATGVLLVGAAVSAGFTAVLIALLSAAEGFQTRALFRFLSGALTDVTWQQTKIAGICLAAGLVVSAAMIPALGALRLGRSAAAAVGVAVGPARVRILLLAVVLVSVVVSVCGPISWVGLLAPALTRGLLPAGRPGQWFVTAALLGGAVTVTADLLARWTFDPLETPLGVWTAAVAGAPVLAVTIVRMRRAAGGGS